MNRALSMKRLFFALWPTDEVRAGWAGLFPENTVQPSVPPERRHLTLAYLGEITSEEEVRARQVADTVSSTAFSLTLDKYYSFEKQRVVWLGCTQYCNGLQYLVDLLREGLRMQNLPAESRPFTPHMTLLRKHRKVPEGWKQPNLQWAAKDFVLVHSHRRDEGLCYDLIGRWPLKGDGHAEH